MNMLFYCHEICKYLRRMIHVREAVPYGNARMLRKKLDDFLLEAAVLYAVVEAAENLSCILKRFLLAHLAV